MQYLKVQNYPMEQQLSPNFKVGELIESRIAYNQKLYMQYVKQERIMANLEFLVVHLLQPLRDIVKEPILISSGYRCKALNVLAGGAANSLHIQGLAADIYSPGRNLLLVKALQNMEFHECLIHNSYIHVSIKELNNECRCKNLTGNKYYDVMP